MPNDTYHANTHNSSSVSEIKSLNSEYAGNGKHFPVGSVTFETRTVISGNVDSSATTASDFKVSVLLSTKAEKSTENLEKTLCEKYPLISIDNEVFGEPRLVGTRFGVSDVLSAFCMYDSIEEIIEEHGNRYTEQQLRDAVRFARDFLDAFYVTS